jgi:hypothetical protein
MLRGMKVLLLAVALLVASPAHAACGGDCDGDGQVRVDEIVGLVSCALNVTRLLAPCLACADGDASGAIEVHELIGAVAHALDGCPRETFVVRVYLNEFVGGGGYYRGTCARLEPLGLRGVQDLQSGEFRFDGVPPGRYDLQPGCDPAHPCNPFGCWPRHVPVEVSDRDVGLTVPLHVPCRATPDCDEAGGVCVAPGGSAGCGVCVDEPDACRGDGDCDGAKVCVPDPQASCPCDGTPPLVCAPACGGDGDCTRGERCADDGRCVRPSCASDCGDDYCVLGGCYDERGSCQLPRP